MQSNLSVEQIALLEKYVFTYEKGVISVSSDEALNLFPEKSDRLALSALRAAYNGDLKKATAIIEELEKPYTSSSSFVSLAELRALTTLKKWDRSRSEVQTFLKDQLGLHLLDYEDAAVLHPTATSTQAGGGPTTLATQLPSQLPKEQVSLGAFMDAAPKPLQCAYLAEETYPLVFALSVRDDLVTFDTKIEILKNARAPCLLPGVAAFIVEWVDKDERTRLAHFGPRGPALQWLSQNVDKLTPAIIHEIFSRQPDLLRKCWIGREAVAALARKLEGYDATATVQDSSYPEAVAYLERVVQLCNKLGTDANWLSLRALRGAVRLGAHHGCLDLEVLRMYLAAAAKAVFGSSRPDVPATDIHEGVSCDVCHTNPIVGMRYRSKKVSNWDCCSNCINTHDANVRQPFETIGHSDASVVRLYHDDPSLGELLEAPAYDWQMKQEAAATVVDAIFWDGHTHWGRVCDICNRANFRGKRYTSTARHDWDCCEACRHTPEAVAVPNLVETPAPGEKLTPIDSSPLAAVLDTPLHRRMAAEALLLRGLPDPSIAARTYQEEGGNLEALQARQEVEWLRSNRRRYVPQEPIHLQIAVKGVQSVGIRVYQINSWTYYCNEGQVEVGPQLQLAGLGATWSTTLTFPATPFTREVVDVKCLEGRRGTFVVELLAGGGTGLSRRAVIHKGHIRCLQRDGLAGHVFRLFHEDWSPVQEPRIFLGGRTYTPSDGDMEEAPAITVPYAGGGKPGGLRTLVLGGAGGIATLHYFQHREEEYQVDVGWYLEREALVPQGAAPLMVRLSLTQQGRPCPPSLVEQLQLTITSTDREDTTSSKVVEGFQLDEASGLGVHWLRVPPWCRSLEASLTGRILLAAPGANGEPQYQSIESSHRIDIFNGSAEEAPIWDVFLQALPNTPGAWCLRMLGRAGEPPVAAVRAGMEVAVELRHRMLPGAARSFRLQPDADGMIVLGSLDGIKSLSAELHIKDGGVPSLTRQWFPAASGVVQAACPRVNGWPTAFTTPGAPVKVPCTWPQDLPLPAPFLLKVNEDNPSLVIDVVEGCVQSEAGYLVVTPQLPGSYVLHSPNAFQTLQIRVVEPLATEAATAAINSEAASGWQLLLTKDGAVRPTEGQPLQVVAASCDGREGVRVQLAGSAAELEAVQVVITLLRFQHANGSLTEVEPPAQPNLPDPLAEHKVLPSEYLQGVDLDPAIVYTLQRRHHAATHPPRPGIMLPPPSLLTRPVTCRDTDNAPIHLPQPPDLAAFASAFAGPGTGAMMRRCAACRHMPLKPSHERAPPPSLDFCPTAVVLGPVCCNPATGLVHVSAEEVQAALGGGTQGGVGVEASGHTLVRVAALSCASGAFATAQVPVTGGAHPKDAPVRDQGLAAAEVAPGQGIPPVMEGRRIDALAAGASVQVTSTGTKYSALLSQEEAWALLGTLLGQRGARHASGKAAAAVWREWSFLARWGGLAAAEKAKLLKQYASHELHFFIAHRDPEYFEAAVLPLLRAKLPDEREFMDWYLLGDQSLAARWGPPHRMKHLNAAERAILAAAVGGEVAARVAADTAAACLPRRDDQEGAQRYRRARQREFQALLSKGVLDPPTRPGGAVAKGGGDGEGGDGDDEATMGGEEGGTESDRDEEWEDLGGLADDTMFGGSAGLEMLESAAAPQMYAQMAAPGAPPMPPPPPAMAAPMAMAFGAAAPAPRAKARMDGMKKELAARQQQQQQALTLFTPTLKTQEWGEASWWGLTPTGHRPGPPLVPASEFWADWAAHLAGQAAASGGRATDVRSLHGAGFLSAHLLQAATTFTSAALALALVGLPRAADAKGIQIDPTPGGLTITARTPCLLAVKETRPADAPPAQGRSSVAVMQYIFDPLIPLVQDPETGDNMSRVEEGPLLAGRRYGCTAVITSMSLSPLTLDLLAQAPQGALPLTPEPSPQATTITLGPYSSHHLQLLFYFPSPGIYPPTPLSISTKGRLLWAPPTPMPPLQVLPALPPSPPPHTSFNWAAFISSATDHQVLEYLRTGNLREANLDNVVPRCANASFYLAATKALRGRMVFHERIWEYSVKHLDEAGLREYLPNTRLASHLHPYAATPLLSVQPSNAGYHHLEYWPVVNRFAHGLPNLAGGARAGGVGQGGGLLQEVSAIRTQWASLLLVLLRKGVGPLEALQAAYHLALQGRVEDTEALLARYLPSSAPLEGAPGAVMQLDYLRAWLDLAGAGQELAVATEVAAKYKGTADPVWGPKFRELASTLAEINGIAAVPSVMVPGEKVEGEVAEPILTVRSPPGPDSRMLLYCKHLRQIQVEVYEMDVELLFTLQPFELLGASGSAPVAARGRGTSNSQPNRLSQVSYVKAKDSQNVTLPEGKDEGEVALHLAAMFPALANSSVVVEVAGGGLRRTCLRYASGMEVNVMEAQGLLQVVASATRRPLPAAYVKVFAESAGGGRPWFHKDGYTDRRGKFDFAKVVASTAGAGGVDGEGKPSRFAILVLHEQGGGAVIAEAAAMQ